MASYNQTVGQGNVVDHYVIGVFDDNVSKYCHRISLEAVRSILSLFICFSILTGIKWKSSIILFRPKDAGGD